MTTRKFASIGIDKHQRLQFEAAIDLASGLQAGRWTYTDNTSEADVLLLATETKKAQDFDQNSADSPLIVHYLQEDSEQTDTELSIREPIFYKKVITLLRKVEPALANRKQTLVDEQPKTSPEPVVEEIPKTTDRPAPEEKSAPSIDMLKMSAPVQTMEPENVKVDERLILDTTITDELIENIQAVEQAVIQEKVATETVSNEKPASDNIETLDLPLTEEITKDEPQVLDEDITNDNLNIVEEDPHDVDWLSEENDALKEDKKPVEITAVSPAPGEKAQQKNTPELRLYQIIDQAIHQSMTIHITHPRFPAIRIFPENSWFVITDELDSHPAMFRTNSSEFEVTKTEREIKDELFNGHLPQSLWKLVYTAALYGSEGRLIKPMSDQDQLHLKHSPYFGMIPHTEQHIALANYMIANSASIHTIAKETDIDINTAINFCNGCQAIDLIQINKDISLPVEEIDKIEGDTTLESEMDRTLSQKTDKLLSSLWSKMTK